ncbi:hypothetical protein D3C77_634050 [compost metagenome]
MIRRPAQAQNHTGMLNLPIWIQQLGANDTHFRALPMVHQRFQPIFTEDSRIVVQQDKVFATRLACGHVVDR